MRLTLRELLPFTPIAIPVAALVAYWGPVTDWLIRWPDAPKSLAFHSLYRHATDWTIVWRGAHVHPREVYGVAAALLFLLLMRALMSYHERRPRRPPILEKGRSAN